MKLMDSSPEKGGSLGMMGTGPATKNLARLNDAAHHKGKEGKNCGCILDIIGGLTDCICWEKGIGNHKDRERDMGLKYKVGFV